MTPFTGNNYQVWSHSLSVDCAQSVAQKTIPGDALFFIVVIFNHCFLHLERYNSSFTNKKKLKFYLVVIVQGASNLAQWLFVKLDTGQVMNTCVIEIQCDSVVDLLNAQYP